MNVKVLVVIDNVVQYERIKEIIQKRDLIDNFVFRHSPVKSAIWNHPDFEDKKTSILDVNENYLEIIKIFDLVISVHCFQFFRAELVNGIRCVNIHPGYNPINRGWYPQVFAIINDLPIGATIHEMDEKLDNGAIICRSFVEKHSWDTSLTIYNRVLIKEIEMFEEYFDSILVGDYKKVIPENKGNFFSKKDFNDLCQIDLAQNGTFKDFYNRLRALSHGEYKNAYFIDSETGNKVFIKLDIHVENN